MEPRWMDGWTDGRTAALSCHRIIQVGESGARCVISYTHTHTHTHIYIYVYRYTGRLSQTGRSLSSCIRASVLFLFLLLLLFFIACSALTFAVTVATANPSEWISSILSSHRLWWEREEKEKQGEKKKERERGQEKKAVAINIDTWQAAWVMHAAETRRWTTAEEQQRQPNNGRGQEKREWREELEEEKRKDDRLGSNSLLCQSQRNNFSSSLFSCSAGIV